MHRYWICMLSALLAAAGSARGETRRAVFAGAGTEITWTLKDLDPGLPADWSPFQFLVLELRLSSPQRFDLRIHDANGVRSVRLAPVPGAWIRSAVPLSFLTQPPHSGNDLASVHNKARPMMFINLSGTPGELKSVSQLGVVMANPIGAPSLEIRAVRLANQDPGDALLEAKPLVDQFGQWMGDDWPGKATSLEQLQAAWAAEDKALGKGDFSYCRYGGYEGSKAKATGFFRVEKIEGKWWFVDPDGHLFLSLGADSIGTSVSTSTQGREQLFAALPPADLAGGRGGGRGGAGFSTSEQVARFGAGRDSGVKKVAQAFLAAGDSAERRKAFLYEAYQKFIEAATAAIRKHDPNHLSLGLRFGSSAPPEIVRLSKVFDVYSLNNYAYKVNQTEIDKVRSLIDKPMLIGEFHFGTPGRGMTPGLKQTSSQEERGVAYRYYVENALADPSIVGAHWFEWIDEPSTGRFDGENYNIGLVDVTDRPYRELLDAAQATHKRLQGVHAGSMPPVTRKAKVQ